MPAAEDFPDSDDTPVDKNLQNLFNSWLTQSHYRHNLGRKNGRVFLKEPILTVEQKAAKLAAKLRSLGIDPEEIDSWNLIHHTGTEPPDDCMANAIALRPYSTLIPSI